MASSEALADSFWERRGTMITLGRRVGLRQPTAAMAGQSTSLAGFPPRASRPRISWMSAVGVGVMNEGDNWSDCFANTDPRFVPHHDALHRAVIERVRRRGGD